MQTEINLTDNGMFIFENVPPGTEVGIDYHSWHVGPRFKGISNIPCGFHFIFFSVADKHQEYSPRTGFFVFIQPSDIIVKKYDSAAEDFVTEEVNVEAYLQNIEDTAKYLAPYPTKECKKWSSLTNYITRDLVQRVQPKCGKINCLTEVSLESAGRRKRNAETVDSRIVHELDTDSIMNFTNIPSDFPDNITAQEKSKYCMDSTYFLEKMVECFKGDVTCILGELQIAFISFLVGQVYDAFEYWKDLITLITNCQEAISKRPKFFIDVIEVLSIHMDEIPDDYFVDITAQNNFLLRTFECFFQNFTYLDVLNPILVKKASLLKHKLTTRFEWDFNEENEDEMPVIVET